MVIGLHFVELMVERLSCRRAASRTSFSAERVALRVCLPVLAFPAAFCDIERVERELAALARGIAACKW